MMNTKFGQKVEYKYTGEPVVALRNVTKIEYDAKGVHFYSKIHKQGVVLPRKHYTGKVLAKVTTTPETKILKKFT